MGPPPLSPCLRRTAAGSQPSVGFSGKSAFWGNRRQGDKAKFIVKHTTEFHIKCVKFSPFEEDRLFTCGVDSIRSYRLKGGQLRGISIQVCAARRPPPAARRHQSKG